MGVDRYGVGHGFEMAARLAKNPRLGPPPVQGEEGKTGSRKIGRSRRDAAGQSARDGGKNMKYYIRYVKSGQFVQSDNTRTCREI